MFIIITWDDPNTTRVIGDRRAGECHKSFNFKSHFEAQDFIYNSANDTYLASKTKIVELN
jgi:hypothetical protein